MRTANNSALYILKSQNQYVGLVCIFAALFMLNINLPAGLSPIQLHLSNFYLTGGAFLVSCYKTLVKAGYTKGRLLILMLPFALLNLVVEIAVNIDSIRLGNQVYSNINAADPVDALFGLAALGILYIYLTRADYLKK